MALIIALAGSALRAEDWPQWRGVNRDGVWHEAEALIGEKGGGMPVLWRVAAGPGWSSPIIADGRVYLTDVEMKPPESIERVRCFDEITGEVLWTHGIRRVYPDWALQPGQENGPTATPVLADGRLYTIGPFGDAACLDAVTGKPVWERALGKDYEIKEMSVRGSPLIEGGRLILAIGGKPGACLLALDKATGKEVWHALDEDIHNSSPIAITAAGRRQIVIWTQQSVSALNPVNGAVLWRERLLTDSNNGTSTPVWDQDRLLISGLMFKLGTNKPGASVIWPDTRSLSHRVLSNTSTPLLIRDLIFSARSAGALVCLDAKTGKELWSREGVTSKGSGAAIHLTANGGTVLLYNDQGEVIRARLSAAGYEEISRATILEPDLPFGGRKVAWSAASYANGKVFARSHRELVCATLAAQGK